MEKQLKLYNALGRSKKTFEPIKPEHVGVYVCGPTVYSYAHIGNARPAVVFDMLVRLLRHLYPSVLYVSNITDVDDKIMDAAQKTDQPIHEITTKYTKIYNQDMRALGVIEPDVQPFATDHITQMITMISALVEKGHAYEAEGNVLFHVPSFKEYGRLSGRNRDEQVAGARVDVAPYKKDAADFVLWKPSTADQPGWDSPWGRGRPGWHIECSAMSKEYLGDVFDIHGGGIDLTFPHHENEQAQSCCASGRDEFARYWVHNGFVTVEGEKMSKSLGNVLLVHDLLEEYDGEALRLNLLSAHYRQPLDWTKNGLESCQNILVKFYQALSEIEGYGTYDASSGEVAEDVMDALLDDMNTPMAMAALHRMFKAFNESSESVQKKEMAFRIKSTAYLMGVLQEDPQAWLARNLERESGDLDENEVIACIQKRAEARKAKDFAMADEMRDALSAMGVEIKDGPEGTEWLVSGIVKGRVS